jgi:hypothetical protein
MNANARKKAGGFFILHLIKKLSIVAERKKRETKRPHDSLFIESRFCLQFSHEHLMIPELRPMSTSELLDRTFHLYRNHFVLFAGIAALAPALVLAVELIAIAAGMPIDPEAFDRSGSHLTNGEVLQSLLGSLVLLLVQFITRQLSYGATVYGVSKVHVGEQISIHAAYRSIRPYWIRLVDTSLLIAVRIIGIIVLLFIVIRLGVVGLVAMPFVIWWGVYIYTRCSLAVAVCVLEGSPSGRSVERSRFLTVNDAWRIFLILLLTGVLSSAFTYAFRAPAMILARTHLLAPGVTTVLTRQVGAFFAQTLAAPIGTIALTLVYYDQRIRKEAFDLEIMMQGLKPADVQPAVTSASL